MRRPGAVAVIAIAQALWSAPALAHETRPAYLDLREVVPGRVDVMWKVPARGELRLAIQARLPEACIADAEPTREIVGSAHVERWSADCVGGLKGGLVSIDGLEATLTDALVRIAHADGTTEVAHLKPDAPAFRIAGGQTPLRVAATYFGLGVEHILAGIDHLLFVLALVLLIRGIRMLIKTITAFTVAHSLTLAGSTLGWFSLPQAPVEAAIALSIAFVARELLKTRPGEQRLSAAYPWLVAFSFGLLHGFGFAGALKETGLPQTDVPLALLAFNLGVEAGQLLFVGMVMSLVWIGRKLRRLDALPLLDAASYGIGTVATFWFIERVAAFELP
ncbi:HupE/UreJ family protein [Rhodobacter sp. CZR27]|uniref:HupE/UreJ family protein n=1 Tax=Rhodobacter sp. CZR27 TaxID=2033869 RepID=UPI000BBE50C8|nr:HupE/UreJ family protein [Rhodobacter sp. CZR27]